MAKKKMEQEKEHLSLRDKEYALRIRDVREKANRTGTPTYYFKVGDKVTCGCLLNCVVSEILDDGKIYGISYTGTSGCKGYSSYKEFDAYQFVTWVDIRPICETVYPCFEKNKDIRINFVQQDIHSLIFKHYGFGIDYEPDYQRGKVWDDKDREALLDSIFLKADIGKFVFVRIDDEKWVENNYAYGYEIVDGKQRLLTLIAFFENRFPYKGKYYNDLSKEDKQAFLRTMVSVGELQNATKETILRVFIMLNRGGKPVEQSVIDNAMALLELEKQRNK